MADCAWCDPLAQPGCARVALDELVDPLAGEPVPVLVYEQARLLARAQEQRAAVFEVVAEGGQRAAWDPGSHAKGSTRSSKATRAQPG